MYYFYILVLEDEYLKVVGVSIKSFMGFVYHKKCYVHKRGSLFWIFIWTYIFIYES